MNGAQLVVTPRKNVTAAMQVVMQFVPGFMK